MKKGITYSLILLGLLLVGCMGDGNKTTYFRYGVATINPVLSLCTTDGESETLITSSDFEKRNDIVEGDCFELEFDADLSKASSNNVYAADIHSIEKLPMWPLVKTQNILPDTIPDFDRDQFFKTSFGRCQIIKKRMFLTMEMSDYKEGQMDEYTFHYNPELSPVTTDEGRRVYHLYLRLKRTGGVDTLSAKRLKTNAFLLDDFLKEVRTAEEVAGEDSLYFHINYPERYRTDSTSVQWAQSVMFSLKLSEID